MKIDTQSSHKRADPDQCGSMYTYEIHICDTLPQNREKIDTQGSHKRPDPDQCGSMCTYEIHTWYTPTKQGKDWHTGFPQETRSRSMWINVHLWNPYVIHSHKTGKRLTHRVPTRDQILINADQCALMKSIRDTLPQNREKIDTQGSHKRADLDQCGSMCTYEIHTWYTPTKQGKDWHTGFPQESRYQCALMKSIYMWCTPTKQGTKDILGQMSS